MTEEPPSSYQDKSWFERFASLFSGEPRSREELLHIIRHAASNELLDEEALGIIQGAMGVSLTHARDIMIPRPQMVTVDVDDSPEEFLPKIIESGHSRFPVIGEHGDDVKGILLAKDLLTLILKGHKNFKLEDFIRPATIIPESKRLNILLREFRENRYHMALVIDEYGGISGLITIEDILEEIVGEISDETDDEQDDVFIRQVGDGDFIVKALTPIVEFNQHFKSQFANDEFDTIGGVVMQSFGCLPERNAMIALENFSFRVLYSDDRQIHLLRVTLDSND